MLFIDNKILLMYCNIWCSVLAKSAIGQYNYDYTNPSYNAYDYTAAGNAGVTNSPYTGFGSTPYSLGTTSTTSSYYQRNKGIPTAVGAYSPGLYNRGAYNSGLGATGSGYYQGSKYNTPAGTYNPGLYNSAAYNSRLGTAGAYYQGNKLMPYNSAAGTYNPALFNPVAYNSRPGSVGTNSGYYQGNLK